MNIKLTLLAIIHDTTVQCHTNGMHSSPVVECVVVSGTEEVGVSALDAVAVEKSTRRNKSHYHTLFYIEHIHDIYIVHAYT